MTERKNRFFEEQDGLFDDVGDKKDFFDIYPDDEDFQMDEESDQIVKNINLLQEETNQRPSTTDKVATPTKPSTSRKDEHEQGPSGTVKKVPDVSHVSLNESSHSEIVRKVLIKELLCRTKVASQSINYLATYAMNPMLSKIHNEKWSKMEREEQIKFLSNHFEAHIIKWLVFLAKHEHVWQSKAAYAEIQAEDLRTDLLVLDNKINEEKEKYYKKINDLVSEGKEKDKQIEILKAIIGEIQSEKEANMQTSSAVKQETSVKSSRVNTTPKKSDKDEKDVEPVAGTSTGSGHVTSDKKEEKTIEEIEREIINKKAAQIRKRRRASAMAHNEEIMKRLELVKAKKCPVEGCLRIGPAETTDMNYHIRNYHPRIPPPLPQVAVVYIHKEEMLKQMEEWTKYTKENPPLPKEQRARLQEQAIADKKAEGRRRALELMSSQSNSSDYDDGSDTVRRHSGHLLMRTVEFSIAPRPPFEILNRTNFAPLSSLKYWKATWWQKSCASIGVAKGNRHGRSTRATLIRQPPQSTSSGLKPPHLQSTTSNIGSIIRGSIPNGLTSDPNNKQHNDEYQEAYSDIEGDSNAESKEGEQEDLLSDADKTILANKMVSDLLGSTPPGSTPSPKPRSPRMGTIIEEVPPSWNIRIEQWMRSVNALVNKIMVKDQAIRAEINAVVSFPKIRKATIENDLSVLTAMVKQARALQEDATHEMLRIFSQSTPTCNHFPSKEPPYEEQAGQSRQRHPNADQRPKRNPPRDEAPSYAQVARRQNNQGAPPRSSRQDMRQQVPPTEKTLTIIRSTPVGEEQEDIRKAVMRNIDLKSMRAGVERMQITGRNKVRLICPTIEDKKKIEQGVKSSQNQELRVVDTRIQDPFLIVKGCNKIMEDQDFIDALIDQNETVFNKH
uniref:Uncharacterized protein n=1 Tax=Tetranychus urticae TaxID=32264 RepID=T1KLY7_TETUR